MRIIDSICKTKLYSLLSLSNIHCETKDVTWMADAMTAATQQEAWLESSEAKSET